MKVLLHMEIVLFNTTARIGCPEFIRRNCFDWEERKRRKRFDIGTEWKSIFCFRESDEKEMKFESYNNKNIESKTAYMGISIDLWT